MLGKIGVPFIDDALGSDNFYNLSCLNESLKSTVLATCSFDKWDGAVTKYFMAVNVLAYSFNVCAS